MFSSSLYDSRGRARRLPVVGHALQMGGDPLRLFTALAREHGGMAPIQIGPMKGYLLSDPELLSEVFVSKRKLYTRKTRVYDALAQFLGRGILTTEGDDWRVHRRMVQPAFHKKRLDAFSERTAKITEECLDAWPVDREIDMSDAMMRVTLRIVSEVLLGSETTEYATEIGQAVDDTQRWVERVISEGVPVPRWLPIARNRERDDLKARLDRLAYQMIEERERGERGDDVISMLLDARYEDGSPVPRQRIRDELLTLLAAGHETTANATGWTLMRLSQHPDVARKLEAEVDEVLGGRRPTFEDLPKLRYTRWVFDESLRLHPPAWVTGRVVKEAHQLGGRSMEPGMLVLLSPYLAHRSVDLWDNPEGFDPDRWEKLSERGALPPFAFLPFGGGTRKCVGEAFAYLEATIVLAMCAQRFRFELAPGVPIVRQPRITLGVEGALPMRVKRRVKDEARAPEERSEAAHA